MNIFTPVISRLDPNERNDLKKILLIIFIVSAFVNANDNYSELSKNLYSHVEFLTTTPKYRNHRNIESLNIAADYIESLFRVYSERVEIQSFTDNENEYKNIICSFGPEDGERIVVGTHYDVCSEQPGADDNASGIAGLIEVAKLISEKKPNLTKRVDLVAYTLEEPPHFRKTTMGSYVHAKSLKDAGIEVDVMICIDMIGYYDDTPNSQKYPSGFLKLFYPDEANFIAIVSNFKNHFSGRKVKNLMRKNSNIKVCQLSAPSSLEGIDWSDHLNFWNFGYKAVFITDTSYYRNNRYHKKTDTIDTLNFDKMSEVVNGLYWAVINF